MVRDLPTTGNGQLPGSWIGSLQMSPSRIRKPVWSAFFPISGQVRIWSSLDLFGLLRDPTRLARFGKLVIPKQSGPGCWSKKKG